MYSKLNITRYLEYVLVDSRRVESQLCLGLGQERTLTVGVVPEPWREEDTH